MKKKLLSFFLTLSICIGNCSGISAVELTAQDTTEYSMEESAVETDYESSIEADNETEISEAESVCETVTETVIEESTDDETTVDEVAVTTEYDEIPVAESPSFDVSLSSRNETYDIDKEAPYSGEYVIMTNSKKLSSTTAERVGTLPDIVEAEDEINLQEDLSVDDNIMGYDSDGRGLIDPASFLEEEVLDENGIPDDSEYDNVSLQEEYTVGSLKTLYLKNNADKANHATSCVCVAVGTYCVVWVPESDPIYKNSPQKMKDYMSQLAAEFDAKYPQLTTAFGDLSNADRYGDQDGKVSLICYDLFGDGATAATNYTSGYFSGLDMDLNFKSKSGNNMDCLHIDSWQAMYRSADKLSLTNVSFSYETMVHELQHMILWSNMRKIERKNGGVTFEMNVPSWINEGFSEAAVQLCYGGSTGRINRFNQGSTRSGRLSIYNWSSNVESYALCYLFFQYVRTQYSQIAGEGGWKIYSTALDNVTYTSDDSTTADGAAVLDAIATQIGVSSEELVENFWIATYMLNSTGPYGFAGEEWAEEIVAPVTSSPAQTLVPGASQMIKISSPFTPSGYGEDIVFAGLDKSGNVPGKKGIVISGARDLKTIGDTVQLSAEYSESDSPTYIWSVPKLADRDIITVSDSGLVTAVSYGKATIRATLSGNPSIYGEIEITALQDTNKIIRFTKRTQNTDYGEKTFTISSTNVPEATLYYTTNGSEATTSSMIYTSDGIKITRPGTTRINILAVADGYYSTRTYEDVTLDLASAPQIDVQIGEDSNCTITIDSSDPANVIYYSLDGNSPLTNGIRYPDRAITALRGDITVVLAISRRKGYIDSDIVMYRLDDTSQVEIPDLDMKAITDGYEIKLISNDSSLELRYTIDGSEPTKSSPVFPKNGITLKKEGKTILKIRGWKEGFVSITKSFEISITRLDPPEIKYEYIGYLNSYKVTLEDSVNSEVKLSYSVDGGEEKEYKEPFIVDAESDHIIYGYASKEGHYKSLAGIRPLVKVEPEYRRLTSVPRTETNNVTLNKQYDNGVSSVISLMSYEGQEIYSCSLDGKNSEAFSIEHIIDDYWKISLKDKSLKAGGYKINVLMRGTEYEEEPPQKVILNIKVLDKSPAVTVKKVTAYKNYSGVVMPLNVSSKDGNVEILGVTDKVTGFSGNFEVFDSDEDGHFDSLRMKTSYNNLILDDRGKPVLSGYLRVKVAGYVEQKVALNVAINNSLPKISQSVSSIKYNNQAFAADGCRAVIGLNIVNSANKKVAFNVGDGDVKIDTSSKQYAKIEGVLDKTSPVGVDESGAIVIRLAANADGNYAGNYVIPLLISGQSEIGSFINVPIQVKFAVDKQSAAVKTTLKPATIKLNKKIDDHAYTEVRTNYSNILVKDMECTPMPSNGKNNTDEKVKLRYNASTSRLEAYFDGYAGEDSITCKTYKFECKPKYVSTGGGIEFTDDSKVQITVNILSKSAMISVASKGKIDTLNRASTSIRYTVKRNGFEADYEKDIETKDVVGIARPDGLGSNEMDGSESIEFIGDPDVTFSKDGYVDIRLKEGAQITRGQKYVFRLRIMLENGGYVYSPNIKITPVQGTPKFYQDKTPVLYKNVNLRNRTSVITLSTNMGELKSITLNSIKNKKIPEGLVISIDEIDGHKINVKLNDSSVKAGTYTVNFNVIYKDEMLEKDGNPKVYPITAKIIVK